MAPNDLIESATDHFNEWEEYALSSYCCDGKTADELALIAGPRLRHPKIRESTVGAIRNLGQGYEVMPSGRKCYSQILLPGLPTMGSMIQLAAVFSGARAKPVQQGG